MYPVLHHGDELLIAEETIAVVVEYLEDCVHHVGTQVLPSADVNSPRKLVLKYHIMGKGLKSKEKCLIFAKISLELPSLLKFSTGTLEIQLKGKTKKIRNIYENV